MFKFIVTLGILCGALSAEAVNYRCAVDYEAPGISCCGRTRTVTFDLHRGGRMLIQDQGRTSRGASEIDWSKDLRISSATRISAPFEGVQITAQFKELTAEGKKFASEFSVQLGQKGTFALMNNTKKMQCKRIR